MARAAATRQQQQRRRRRTGRRRRRGSTIVLPFCSSSLASSVASLTWRCTRSDALAVSSLTRSALDIASGMEGWCTRASSATEGCRCRATWSRVLQMRQEDARVIDLHQGFSGRELDDVPPTLTSLAVVQLDAADGAGARASCGARRAGSSPRRACSARRHRARRARALPAMSDVGGGRRGHRSPRRGRRHARAGAARRGVRRARRRAARDALGRAARREAARGAGAGAARAARRHHGRARRARHGLHAARAARRAGRASASTSSRRRARCVEWEARHFAGAQRRRAQGSARARCTRSIWRRS